MRGARTACVAMTERGPERSGSYTPAAFPRTNISCQIVCQRFWGPRRASWAKTSEQRQDPFRPLGSSHFGSSKPFPRDG
eukprot:8930604-Pyramimonas_sp.AAC.1